MGRTLHLSRSAAARQEELKAFDRDQLARFFGATAKAWPRFYPLFLTMARTGMRIGEALALPWDDVDFAQREIRVARAVSSTGQVGFVTPDDAAGSRLVATATPRRGRRPQSC